MQLTLSSTLSSAALARNQSFDWVWAECEGMSGSVATICCTCPCTGLSAMDLAVCEHRRLCRAAYEYCAGRKFLSVIPIY